MKIIIKKISQNLNFIIFVVVNLRSGSFFLFAKCDAMGLMKIKALNYCFFLLMLQRSYNISVAMLRHNTLDLFRVSREVKKKKIYKQFIYCSRLM